MMTVAMMNQTVTLTLIVVCGNNVQEGTEECDGTDDAACPGLCQENCSCCSTCDNEDSICTSSTGSWSISGGPDSHGDTSLYSFEGTYTWTPEAPEAGRYEVSMWWTLHSTRHSAATVTISCGEVVLDIVPVNQQANGGQWNILGSYCFEAGNECSITITSDDPSFSVCADAVKVCYV